MSSFEAWGIKDIQTALNIIDYMAQEGLTVEDLRAYRNNYKTLLDVHIARKDNRPVIVMQHKPCPVCRKPMRLMPETGHDKYKSKWLCAQGCGSCNAGGGCGYVEFNELSIEEIIIQGGAQ